MENAWLTVCVCLCVNRLTDIYANLYIYTHTCGYIYVGVYMFFCLHLSHITSETERGNVFLPILFHFHLHKVS